MNAGISNKEEAKDVLSAILMDNTMAKDALEAKNYRALLQVLDRQRQEIEKLSALILTK